MQEPNKQESHEKTSWHSLTSTDVVSVFESHESRGLSEQAATDRAAQFGPNELTRTKGQGPVIRFLLQFKQPLVIILLAATLITLFLAEYIDAGVIFAVVMVNAIIGFVQEAKAMKAIEALSRAMTSEATIIRDGRKIRIAAVQLVPGDLVLLQSGDKVPADLRLIQTRELQINESALTGESVPVQKEEGVLEADMAIGDRRNMAYSSTLVTYGSGRGIVVATGDNTEIGRINQLIATTDVLETPLTRKIHHFSGILLYAILAMAALTFVIGFVRGQNLVETFMASVALAVGAIPEGLPAAITITLAIGVSRMASRNAIIRKLPAVETLGSTMIICSDKTGTLTQNQMTVQSIVAGGQSYTISGVGYHTEGQITSTDNALAPPANHALQVLLKAGMLCNDAALKKDGENLRVEG
ncbi:MAG: HAD-IC family P-type ATPase, partial [Deltaproteobacteria bacterium]